MRILMRVTAQSKVQPKKMNSALILLPVNHVMNPILTSWVAVSCFSIARQPFVYTSNTVLVKKQRSLDETWRWDCISKHGVGVFGWHLMECPIMNCGEPFVGTVFQALIWPSDIIYLFFDEAAASVHHFQILFPLTRLL